jgi:chemotaxis protein methyltransferase CheR
VAYRYGPGAGTPAIPSFEQSKLPLRNVAPLPSAPKPAEPTKPQVLPRPAKAPPKAPVSNATPPAPDALLDKVKAQANSGEFATADALCRKALADQPLSAAFHFYHGLVLQALNRPDDAENSFLKSIYLDKSFAMAHYHLGLLLLAEGRSGSGRRALTNAARVASMMRDDHLLDESDGITAMELRNLVRIHLEAAPPSKRRS